MHHGSNHLTLTMDSKTCLSASGFIEVPLQDETQNAQLPLSSMVVETPTPKSVSFSQAEKRPRDTTDVINVEESSDEDSVDRMCSFVVSTLRPWYNKHEQFRGYERVVIDRFTVSSPEAEVATRETFRQMGATFPCYNYGLYHSTCFVDI